MTDQAGRAALDYAALETRANEVSELLAAGHDPNARDQQGFVPLHFAAQQGGLEVLTCLLEGGAAVDPEDAYGNTPLWTAVFNRGRGKRRCDAMSRS